MKVEKEIYIVEDSEIIRKILIHTVSQMEGYCAKGFARGEEMLTLLRIQKPALILLDFFLDTNEANNLSGPAVLSEIKEIDPKIPVVMISGSNQALVLEKIKTLPLETFIHKNAEDALEEIETAVRKFTL